MTKELRDTAVQAGLIAQDLWWRYGVRSKRLTHEQEDRFADLVYQVLHGTMTFDDAMQIGKIELVP
jgi:hypothetical protein